MCTVSKIVTISFPKISCENRVYSESCAIPWNTLYPDANVRPNAQASLKAVYPADLQCNQCYTQVIKDWVFEYTTFLLAESKVYQSILCCDPKSRWLQIHPISLLAYTSADKMHSLLVIAFLFFVFRCSQLDLYI